MFGSRNVIEEELTNMIEEIIMKGMDLNTYTKEKDLL